MGSLFEFGMPRRKIEPAKEVTRKKRRKKDPNAPKRALTPYIFFLQKRRPELTAKHPNWKFTDIGKKLGSEWGSMTDSQKKSYVALAAKDAKRFASAMKSYTPPPPSKRSEGDTKTRKKRRKKDPNAPKRALTAYVFFLQKRRPELTAKRPNWKFTDIGKKLGSEWGSMTDSQKKSFVALAAKDAKRFATEMESYTP